MTGGKTAGMIVHRVFSAVLGLVLAVAGLAASDYIPGTFKGDTLLSGAVAVLTGCGGGGGGAVAQPAPVGTPAGSYSITVTATSGSMSHTQTVNVIIR
jgi:hypothetical protein